MDDRRFDTFTRALAARRSRRQLLRVLMSLGAVASGAAQTRDTHAARRSYSGPSRPPTAATPPPCHPTCLPGSCGGPDMCGGTCACSDGLWWRAILVTVLLPPRAEQVDMDVWTAEEANAFLAATSKHSLHALYLLALSTGMRQG